MKQHSERLRKEFDCSVMKTWFHYMTSSEIRNNVNDSEFETTNHNSIYWLFRYNNDDVVQSRQAAKSCPFFIEDDEDEMVDDELLSCFNCMHRRWLAEGFECHGLSIDESIEKYV